MNKNTRTVILVGVLAVGAYLLYRWYINRQAATGTGQGAVSQLGSNLNSLAPELVGGSSGPSSGPQVTMPVTITLTEPPPSGHSESDLDDINPGGPMVPGPNTPAFTPSLTAATGGPASTNPDNALVQDQNDQDDNS